MTNPSHLGASLLATRGAAPSQPPPAAPSEGGLQYYQWWGLLAGGSTVAFYLAWFLKVGFGAPAPFLLVPTGISGVFLLGALLIWDRYPRRTELTAEGLVFHQRLGNSRVSWANLGPPTHNQGRWVLFKTDPKTPGFAGSPATVDRPTARMILRSSHRNSWAVPPEFQYLVEWEQRPAINSSVPAG